MLEILRLHIKDCASRVSEEFELSQVIVGKSQYARRKFLLSLLRHLEY